ncbi:hypothetical protein [Streptomyces liliifuscus]|uniref:Uncharacterized protein n=1 Tax=Streptomyces liliifuscus TaxID=2797636 RepID=A0A7T7L212_9ACTN|nr:hypothetical protein [Streptomyces liliifuscus]QQM44989.1 hypothetical protein JEQ17_40030 [Streptomyces liliifuscus]
MTYDVLAIGAIGGLAALVGLIVFVAVGLGVYAIVRRAVTAHEAYQQRRQLLRTCRAIDALGTSKTDH